MPSTSHSVKRGDTKTLKWDLGRDLTGVTTARVIISKAAGVTPAVDRSGVIVSPATGGIVTLALAAADYGAGKLEAGNVYLVEIETSPGPLTHPDGGAAPYATLTVLADLG